LKDTDTNGTDDAGGESGPTVYNQYGYDDIDRLTTVAYHNSDTEGFVMDDLGNRTGNQTLRGEGTVHFAVDTLTNRYTAVAGNPLAYDDAGNLTQDKDGYRYVYDCENRITRIFKLDGQTEVDVAFYAYDAFGRRICKTSYDSVPSVATLYYYSDNWQVLAEYDGSGGVQAYYVFGNYIDEVLLMHRDTADHYYLHDHLYSPVALLDDDGDVLERCEYDAYGSVQILTSNFSPLTSSQYGNPYAFTGRELDTLDAGNCTLMHYRHRAYNPEIGRFMQQDPHGINPAGGKEAISFNPIEQYADGCGLMAYVTSNPINRIDPYGLMSHYGKYIPRGSIGACVGQYQESNRARSDVTIDFKPDRNIGQYCDEIGFIQIEKLHALKKFPYRDEYNDWMIDDKIPYSNSRHWHKGDRIPFAEMSDTPGWDRVSFLRYLVQDFETCAVCLKGCEKGAYYGCATWGHSFTRFEKRNQYGEKDMMFSRYAFEEVLTGWLNVPSTPSAAKIDWRIPLPPTRTFHSIVDKELIKYIGL